LTEKNGENRQKPERSSYNSQKVFDGQKRRDEIASLKTVSEF